MLLLSCLRRGVRDCQGVSTPDFYILHWEGSQIAGCIPPVTWVVFASQHLYSVLSYSSITTLFYRLDSCLRLSLHLYHNSFNWSRIHQFTMGSHPTNNVKIINWVYYRIGSQSINPYHWTIALDGVYPWQFRDRIFVSNSNLPRKLHSSRFK